MVLPLALMGAGIAAPIVGAAVGEYLAGPEEADAMRQLQEAGYDLSNLTAPDLEAIQAQFPYLAANLPKIPSTGQIDLGRIQQVATYQPELIQPVSMGGTAMEQVAVDPRMKQAQLAALARLGEIEKAGGMTLSDRAQLADIEAQERATARGARESVMQNAQARGMAGSGMELVGQLSAEEGAIARQAQRDREIAAQAQARALEAIMQRGQLAGQMRGQEYGEQEALARARDDIARYNAEQMALAGRANVEARNIAAQSRAQEAQRIQEANIGLRGQEQAMRNEAAWKRYGAQSEQAQAQDAAKLAAYGARVSQQQAEQDRRQREFENQQRLAAGRYGVQADMAQARMGRAQEKRRTFAGVGAGAGQAALAGAGYAYGRKNG